ncbi:MAG: hypothetical protein HYU04_02560 [Candidatus Wildermuthbacteria bacterium]|nr:hypothetical protein [Candidatus Wildermuthbacteria bacterium]
MIAFLIPIFVVIFITIFSVGGGNILKNVGSSFPDLRSYFFLPKTSDQKEQKQTPAPSVIRGATPTTPSFILDTIITTGPKEKETIADIKPTFGFSGSVSPVSTQGSILFESKLQGIDTDWVTTQNTRTLLLPAGSREYTLLVRSKLNNVVDQTPASRVFTVNVSPYFQKIVISSLSTATPSLITLKGNLKQGEEISITEWKIRGKAGSFQIPLGIERINPSSSLQPGDLIKVRAVDTVYLSSSRGPFGLGKHFRPNTCMGYLKSSYAFPLAVPSSCSTDKPREEDLLYFLQACQDFVFKKINFSSCAFPDYSKDLTVSADTQCTSYLTGLATGFTYNSCFLRHSDEPGFTTNAWQIFMNTNLLTQKFDTIELVDQNGLVVDQKKYSL